MNTEEALANGVSNDILNNLADFDTVEEIDPEAMTTDRQPPPPAGRYSIRLRPRRDGEKNKDKLAVIAQKFGADRFPANNVTFYVGKKGPNAGKSVLSMFIEQELVMPDGRKYLTASEYASTSLFGKTTRIDDYLRALSGRAGVGMSQAQKIETVYDALVIEPVIEAEIDWEGQSVKVVEGEPVKRQDDATKNEYEVAVCGGKKLNRMSNFPLVTNEAGEPILDAAGRKQYKIPDADDNGNEVSVQWKVGQLYGAPQA